jgi:hypothetical protein
MRWPKLVLPPFIFGGLKADYFELNTTRFEWLCLIVKGTMSLKGTPGAEPIIATS